jgi:hypothetical protein
MIHLLEQKPSPEQLCQMLQAHGSFIKLAIDIEREILAGGGEFHADCEAVLIEDGSARAQVWGADWIPETKQLLFGSLINIRPGKNPSMEILDKAVQSDVDRVVRKIFDAP